MEELVTFFGRQIRSTKVVIGGKELRDDNTYAYALTERLSKLQLAMVGPRYYTWSCNCRYRQLTLLSGSCHKSCDIYDLCSRITMRTFNSIVYGGVAKLSNSDPVLFISSGTGVNNSRRSICKPPSLSRVGDSMQCTFFGLLMIEAFKLTRKTQ